MEAHVVSSGIVFLPELLILFTLFPGAYQLLQRLSVRWRMKYPGKPLLEAPSEQLPELEIVVEEEEVLLKEY